MTEEEKLCFLKWGYCKEEELLQLDKAMEVAILTVGEQRIDKEEAISLLGQVEYLSGISRAAFHWSSSRKIPGSNQCVSFDCSKMLE